MRSHRATEKAGLSPARPAEAPGIARGHGVGAPKGEGHWAPASLCTLLSRRCRGWAPGPGRPFPVLLLFAGSPVPPLRASSALPPQPGCGSVHGPIAWAGNLTGSGAGRTHNRHHMLPGPTVCSALGTDGLSGISRPFTPREIVTQRHGNIPAPGQAVNPPLGC